MVSSALGHRSRFHAFHVLHGHLFEVSFGRCFIGDGGVRGQFLNRKIGRAPFGHELKAITTGLGFAIDEVGFPSGRQIDADGRIVFRELNGVVRAQRDRRIRRRRGVRGRRVDGRIDDSWDTVEGYLEFGREIPRRGAALVASVVRLASF